MNCRRLLLIGFLILLLPACQGPGDGQLTVVFPSATSELFGGQPLQARLTLVDHDDQPVKGATIQMELHSPGGDIFATQSCTDKGRGYYYMADHVRLPLRGAEGTWRVVAQAAWGDGKQTQTERTFMVFRCPDFNWL